VSPLLIEALEAKKDGGQHSASFQLRAWEGKRAIAAHLVEGIGGKDVEVVRQEKIGEVETVTHEVDSRNRLESIHSTGRNMGYRDPLLVWEGNGRVISGLCVGCEEIVEQRIHGCMILQTGSVADKLTST